jgi:hypothetical protein
LNDIFKELDKFKNMCVKVGITEDKGSKEGENGVTVAQYATYNELGVLGPPMSQNGGGKWFIPPRPFVRGWADAKRELIAKEIARLTGYVAEGKLTAEAAIKRLGEYGKSGIKDFIRHGSFDSNSDVTKNGSKPGKNGKQFIKPKKSSQPLIDNGTMRKLVDFQVIEKPVSMMSEK